MASQNIQNSSAALEQQTRDYAAQGIDVVYQVEHEYFTYLDPEAVNDTADGAYPFLFRLPSGTTPLEAYAILHPAARSHFSDSDSFSDTFSEPDQEFIAATIDQLDSESNSDTFSEPDQESIAATIDQLDSESNSDTFSEPDQESIAATIDQLDSESNSDTFSEPDQAVTAAAIDQIDPVSTSATSTPFEQEVTPTNATDQPEQQETQAASPEPSEMAGENDDGIPWVKFPPKPEGWKGDPGNPNFKTLGTLSPPIMRQIEPAGPHFLAFARRKRHGRTFSEDERIQAQSKAKKVEAVISDEISEPEDPLMLERDAKDWRGQDHYAVLGLSRYRWEATDEQIKEAYRKKALRHHPDKRKAQGKEDNDSFFKCMQRAMEIISDPVKRRQFDSVDEAADVEPPSKKEAQKRGFFKMWNPVFESEARFSNKQPVPMLGDENSTKQEVDDFYDFWYNFDSWRSFEYLDDDVPDDNEGRDHKRHVEKKNANSRRKKKTEDTSRLRQVVDQALEQDERIKKFRQESKANKNKKKNEREAAAKLEAEEKQKAKEEEERKQKAAEEAAKAERAESKKTKEAAKNAVKKNKRVLKASVKDVNYLATGEAASATQIDGVLTDVELIMGKIDADELAALASKLNLAGKDAGKVQGVYEDEAKRLVGGGKIKEGDLKIIKS